MGREGLVDRGWVVFFFFFFGRRKYWSVHLALYWSRYPVAQFILDCDPVRVIQHVNTIN